MSELPRHCTIAAYCRERYRVLADEDAENLTRQGLRVVRPEEGVLEWQQAGSTH